MTTPTPFTQEEFDLLCIAPPSLGSAVIVSDLSGVVSAVKEMVVMTKAVAAGAAKYPNSQLIQQVHAELHSEEAIKARMDRKGSDKKVKDPTVALEIAYTLARSVGALLNTKVSSQEADEYRQWIIGIAQATAEAAKEGGFLGIGGKRVSEEEQAYLDALAVALQG